MKILLYSDVHWEERSSIVVQEGKKYTLRLENLIKCVNWAQDLAVKEKCSACISLGDFFDKPVLTDQEITALQDIHWNPAIKNYFLVGNHCSSVNDLRYSSMSIVAGPNREVISKPEVKQFDSLEVCFLPYIVESIRKPLAEYFPKANKKRLILSHNDIKGFNFGGLLSKTGFTIPEIENDCDLYINGHLHLGSKLTDKVINIGNLSGKDMSENADKYPHRVIIIDTEDLMNYKSIENPYSLNFYKFSIDAEKDLDKCLHLKDNAVLYITVKDHLVNKLKDLLAEQANIITYRLVLSHELADEKEVQADAQDLRFDYLAKFSECCHNKLEHTKILEEELAKVCAQQ